MKNLRIEIRQFIEPYRNNKLWLDLNKEAYFKEIVLCKTKLREVIEDNYIFITVPIKDFFDKNFGGK